MELGIFNIFWKVCVSDWLYKNIWRVDVHCTLRGWVFLILLRERVLSLGLGIYPIVRGVFERMGLELCIFLKCFSNSLRRVNVFDCMCLHDFGFLLVWATRTGYF